MSGSERLTWLAPRDGQDWRDEHMLAAVEWLTSLVGRDEWAAREDAAAARLEALKVDVSDLPTSIHVLSGQVSALVEAFSRLQSARRSWRDYGSSAS